MQLTSLTVQWTKWLFPTKRGSPYQVHSIFESVSGSLICGKPKCHAAWHRDPEAAQVHPQLLRSRLLGNPKEVDPPESVLCTLIGSSRVSHRSPQRDLKEFSRGHKKIPI